MKTLLLGMNNPHSDDPRHDLYPLPRNATGWRIWQMLNSRTGATKKQYLDAFDRRNILHSRTWNKENVDKNACHFLVTSKPLPKTVVLLGDDVRKTVNSALAMNVEKILIHPQEAHGITWRCVPHPSGRNHFYNDPIQKELVAVLLEDLYRCP